jgi:hypothetical protein
MLKKALKQLLAFIFCGLIGVLSIWGAHESSKKSLIRPTENDINRLANVGENLSFEEKRAVIRSRRSAVQVMSVDLYDGGISGSSGTYITYQDKYFVLTTSHGIGEVCELTQIIVGDDLFTCKQYVLRDPQTDYMIIQVDVIPDLVPVDIQHNTPHRQEWMTDLATMNTIYYTGYPNNGGPYTFDGRIVAYRENEALFVDSYGWSGSSGAGVFSASGNLVGWIMALEVGETHFGRQVLENFIWVIPLFNINWEAVGAFAE